MQYMCTYRALCGARDLQAEVGGKLEFGQTNSVAVDRLFKSTQKESKISFLQSELCIM